VIKFLDLARQYGELKQEMDAAISAVITANQFIGGHPVSAFEAAFAEYQGVEHCIGVGNGTDAIEIALEALELPRGGEVIVPANSFIASSEAVTRSGLRVVFADVDPDSYLLDLDDVKQRITPKTCAILAVHLYGNPCDMPALLELAAANDLRVIEDSAQAHGAEWQGRRVGSWGDLSTFSFYPGKNLGAYGDGGAVCTSDPALAQRVRMIANHGRLDKYNHEFEGRNSRLDGLQAAVLSVKLPHLDAWLDRRAEIARRYISALGSIDALAVPTMRDEARHAFHLFVVRCLDRDALAGHLAEREIQTGIHYPIALPKLAAYTYLGQADEQMVANAQDAQLLSLPIGEHLSDADVDIVIGAVREFFTGGAAVA
jgi:dTDP-4-amino-4,6-dideoxygalactose transaminase